MTRCMQSDCKVSAHKINAVMYELFVVSGLNV